MMPFARTGPSRQRNAPGAAAVKPKCVICQKGFQLKKNLHIICGVCGGYFHKRHPEVKCQNLLQGNSFVCNKCNDAPSVPLPAPPPAARVQVPITDPDELLLSETSDLANVPVLVTEEREREVLSTAARQIITTMEREAELPIWDEDIPKMQERLNKLGFKVSPSQPNTLADGSCGIWAILGKQILVYFFGWESLVETM